MQRRDGFTLVELMITVAIVGVLAAVAAPGFFQFIKAQQTTSSANDFVVALNLARSEAIKRGVAVSVCATNDPNQASPSCSGSNDWSQGWMVFTDNVTGGCCTNGQLDSGDGEELIRVGSGTPDAQLTADSGVVYVRFQRDGTMTQRSDFTLAPEGTPNDDENRAITLSPTGRAQVQEPERMN